MKHPLKTFEPNTEGRDFVIGDLHGSFSAFMNLLHNIEFDPDKDRMFSVGDLVDRGPESLRCLELLYEPWFHCVLSNHEQMMLEAFRGGPMGQYWFMNGGRWGMEAFNTWCNNKRTVVNELDRPRPPTDDEARLFDLIEKVAELPFVITVNMKDVKKFHILHAELPPGHVITDEDMAKPEKILEYASVQSHDGDFLVWGRFLFMNFYRANLADEDKVKRTVAYSYRNGSPFNDKLSHIISGHTIMQRPLTILGQTNIDTEAYGSYKTDAKWQALTCIELDTWTFYQATEKEFRAVTPLTVNRADVEQLKKVQENGKADPRSGT